MAATSARAATGRRRSARGALVGDDLLSLRLDRAQPRIDHRGIDEIDRAAAARQALAGAQAVDRAEQVAERIARLGLGADRAQRQRRGGPRSGRARSRRARRRGARRPRSAAPTRSPSAPRSRARRPASRSARSARRAAGSGASRRAHRPSSSRRRATGSPRSSCDWACISTTARSARALLLGLRAHDRQRVGERRVGARPVAQHARRDGAFAGRAQLVGGVAVAVGVARLPAAQRVDARVHEHARARLRDRVLEDADASAARRGRPGRLAIASRARARASPIRSTVSGWVRR